MINTLSAFYFEPILKEKIWGGDNLRTLLSKEIKPNAKIGESWEISGYGKEQSTLPDGTTLQQLLERFGTDLVGMTVSTDYFPLLIKFLDACDHLSVQVHPNDEEALRYKWDQRGKTECWYIVDPGPEKKVQLGFKQGVSLQQVKDGFRSGNFKELLNYVDIEAGDLVYVPAGTVHAILQGTVIYEVQETSDITLRLYDWDRVDEQGKSRDLHVEESLKILSTEYHTNHKIPPVVVKQEEGFVHKVRCANRYFAVEELQLERSRQIHLASKYSFRVLTAISGSYVLYTAEGMQPIQAGQSILIPASIREAELQSHQAGSLILSSVPDLENEIVAPLRSHGIADQAIADLGGAAYANDLLQYLK